MLLGDHKAAAECRNECLWTGVVLRCERYPHYFPSPKMKHQFSFGDKRNGSQSVAHKLTQVGRNLMLGESAESASIKVQADRTIKFFCSRQHHPAELIEMTVHAL